MRDRCYRATAALQEIARPKPLEMMGIKMLVPKKGLEPPRRCRHMDLNHARLPVPPLRLIALRTSEYSQKVCLQKSGHLAMPTFIVQTVPFLSNTTLADIIPKQASW